MMSFLSRVRRARTPSGAMGASPSQLKEAEVPLIARSGSGRAINTTDWDAESAIKHGLKANTWVYVANRFIASKVSTAGWFVEQKVSGGDDAVWERVDDHPAETLLTEPNSVMSGQDLRERWFYNLGLAGNAITTMTIANKVPVELWPLMPNLVKPVPELMGPIAHYEYKPGGGKTYKIEPEKIIHFQYIDPSNLYWGMSPLQAAALVVDTDVGAIKWNASAVANRAKKDYAFFPTAAINKKQWEEARAQLDAQHVGPENAGGFFLGSMPGTLTEMGMSPREMDYVLSRGMNKEEILAAYGLTVVLINGQGILRNYETSVKQFWEDYAIPALDDMRFTLNHSLMPWFDPARRDGGEATATLRLNYDISHIAALQMNFSEKIEQAQALVDLGYPLNEVNKKLGLGMDDLEDGDAPRKPPESIVIGAPAPAALPPVDGRDPAQLPEPDPSNPDARVQAARRPRFNVKRDEYTPVWKSIDDQKIAWEKKVARTLGNMFLEEGQAVVSAYESGGEFSALDTIEKYTDAWYEVMRVVYRSEIEFFGDQEYSRLIDLANNKSVRYTSDRKAFDFSNLIESWIRDTAARKVSFIQEASRSVLARIIGGGVESGQSTDEIAGQIRSRYRDWGDPIPTKRSYTIARTETATATGYAHNESARQVSKETGLNVRKRWVSSRDDRVRESHDEVDGEVVDLDARFSNGLLHPGDSSGPPEEIINCRCVATNIITRR